MMRTPSLALVFAALAFGCDSPGSSDAAVLRSEAVDEEPQAGGGFLPPPVLDVGNQAHQCGPGNQDCPSGEKCTWVITDGGTWNATRCRNVAANPAAPGETCGVVGSAVDNCERGSMCWDVDPETSEGTCRQFPAGNSGQPLCPDRFSILSIGGDGLALCLSGCNPLSQDCSDGLGCYPSTNGSPMCAPDVSPEDGGMAGDPCEFLNVCDPGLWCLAAGATPDCKGTGCCSPICDVSAPECPVGQSCMPWFDGEAPPGQDNIGICST